MECPFCAEDFNDTAHVCKSCGRDLRLVLPLIEENQALVERAGELQLQVNALRAAEDRRTAPLRFWAMHFAAYLLAPVLLLLAMHYLITVTFEWPLLYLRLGSILIPPLFGFSLLMISHLGLRWAAFYGAIVGIVGVLGMLTVVGLTDRVGILPENAREWREVLEYAASIMLAYVTGNAFGLLAQRMVPKTLDATTAPSPAIVYAVRLFGGPASRETLRRRAQKIAGNLGTLGAAAGAVGTAGTSIFAGLRALMGAG